MRLHENGQRPLSNDGPGHILRGLEHELEFYEADTYSGKPAIASAETGRAIVDVLAGHAAEALSEVWTGKLAADDCHSPLWKLRWAVTSPVVGRVFERVERDKTHVFRGGPMAVHADVAGRERVIVAAPLDTVAHRLADIPATLAHFPRLARLTRLEEWVYRWDLEPMGPPTHRVTVTYATRFELAADELLMRILSVPGIGNARIAGEFRLRNAPPGTALDMAIRGEIVVPVSRLLAPLAVPIVRAEFSRLIGGFAANLGRAFP